MILKSKLEHSMYQNTVVFPETYTSRLTNIQQYVLIKDKPFSPQKGLWESLDESKHIEYEKLYNHTYHNLYNITYISQSVITLLFYIIHLFASTSYMHFFGLTNRPAFSLLFVLKVLPSFRNTM